MIRMVDLNSRNIKLLWFLTGVLGSIVFQIFFSPISNKMMSYSFDILDFEFAWKKSRLLVILDSWQPINRELIVFMSIDISFLVLYFLSLIGWTLLLKNDAPNIVILAGGASICDYIENIFSFIAIYQYPHLNAFTVLMISLFAMLKFLIIIIVIVINIYWTLIRIKKVNSK